MAKRRRPVTPGTSQQLPGQPRMSLNVVPMARHRQLAGLLKQADLRIRALEFDRDQLRRKLHSLSQQTGPMAEQLARLISENRELKTRLEQSGPVEESSEQAHPDYNWDED